eukprot:2170314-Pleurochrysis_carterae.AAC.1
MIGRRGAPSGPSGGAARGDGGGGTVAGRGRLRAAGGPEGSGEGCAYKWCRLAKASELSTVGSVE